MTARLLLEYDGTDFAGWASQPGLRSVQGTVEEALETVLRREVRLTVAGRTDRGVHARGQVASHDGEPAPARNLNALLPGDVSRARRARRRPTGSTRAATRARARTATGSTPGARRARSSRAARSGGRGRSTARRSTPVPPRSPGTHDFTAFTPTETDHVRFERDVFRAEWVEEPGDVLAFWIEADTFMRHMVRVLVGTMLEGTAARAVRRAAHGHGRAARRGRRRRPTGSTSRASHTLDGAP